MKKMCVFIFILLIEASPAFSATKRIVVFNFKAIGNLKESLAAGFYLIKQDLSQTGKFDVLDANNFTGGSSCYDVSCAIPIARSQGADMAAMGTMIRVGDTIVVESTVIDAKTGKPMLYNSLKAESPSDLDVVIRRISDSIANNKPVSEAVALNDITQQETMAPRRITSSAYMGLDMGVTAPVASSYLRAGALYNFDSLMFSFELNEHTMLQFKPLLGFSWSNDNNPSVMDWRIMEIGGYYLSGIGNVSPFVGGSISLHLLNMSNQNQNVSNKTDFGLFLGGGVMFFRTSSVHLYIDAGYQTILDSFAGNGAQGIIGDIGFLFRI